MNNKNSKFGLLKPHLEVKVWGGEKLGDKVGESFEVSILENNESKLDDINLSSFCDSKELPYLIKFIDTGDNLSIQVHPGDEYAQVNENSVGKTECWIILDAKKNSGIYLGSKENVSSKDIQNAIETKQDLSKLLKFHNVKRGDFFYVPSGSIHAIGKDVFLIEIQQSSGITYRVWDWNRVGLDGSPRELHLKKALDVIKFDHKSNSDQYFNIQRDCLNKSISLVSHPDFTVQIETMKKNEKKTITKKTDRVLSIISLQGEVKISNKEESTTLTEYKSFITKEAEVTISTEKESVLLVVN